MSNNDSVGPDSTSDLKLVAHQLHQTNESPTTVDNNRHRETTRASHIGQDQHQSSNRVSQASEPDRELNSSTQQRQRHSPPESQLEPHPGASVRAASQPSYTQWSPAAVSTIVDSLRPYGLGALAPFNTTTARPGPLQESVPTSNPQHSADGQSGLVQGAWWVNGGGLARSEVHGEEATPSSLGGTSTPPVFTAMFRNSNSIFPLSSQIDGVQGQQTNPVQISHAMAPSTRLTQTILGQQPQPQSGESALVLPRLPATNTSGTTVISHSSSLPMMIDQAGNTVEAVSGMTLPVPQNARLPGNAHSSARPIAQTSVASGGEYPAPHPFLLHSIGMLEGYQQMNHRQHHPTSLGLSGAGVSTETGPRKDIRRDAAMLETPLPQTAPSRLPQRKGKRPGGGQDVTDRQRPTKRKPGVRDRRFTHKSPRSIVATTAADELKTTGRGPVSIYLDVDVDNLSEYQVLLRRQIELFEAGTDDLRYNAQKMNKSVVRGQVGIRCRHCVRVDPWARGPGSVYYSATLAGLYQACQNMSNNHFQNTCTLIPPELKAKLLELKHSKRRAGGGRDYWVTAARVLGIYEDESGLRFSSQKRTTSTEKVASDDPVETT